MEKNLNTRNCRKIKKRGKTPINRSISYMWSISLGICINLMNCSLPIQQFSKRATCLTLCSRVFSSKMFIVHTTKVRWFNLVGHEMFIVHSLVPQFPCVIAYDYMPDVCCIPKIGRLQRSSNGLYCMSATQKVKTNFLCQSLTHYNTSKPSRVKLAVFLSLPPKQDYKLQFCPSG